MQASILPKRAVREAQKLGVSAAYLSGGVFRAALYWMRRCRATFFRAPLLGAPHGNAGTTGPPSPDTPSNIPCSPPSPASDLFSKNYGI